MMNSLIVAMNDEQPGDGQDRRDQRQDDAEVDLRVRRPVDLGRLVEILRNGVEEALHQPGVHAERATEEQQDQRRRSVEPDRRVEVGDLDEDQVDRDDGQRLREHLHQQNEQHPGATTLEPVPGEGERGAGGNEHGQRRREQRDHHGVVEPGPETGRLEQLGEVGQAEGLGDQRRRAQCAERIERRGHHEQHREDREGQGDDADQVPPAGPPEPVAPRAAQLDHMRWATVAVRGVFQVGGDDRCVAHQLISSRTLVRLNPMIEMTATIRKIRIDTAAAKP